MSDITPVLEGLRDGTVSTGDAVSRFSGRRWPLRLAHSPAVTPGDSLAADVADGSFGEVRAAYAAGWIDADTYAKLAEAYAAAAARAAVPFGNIPGADADGDWDGDTSRWRTAPDTPAMQEDLFAGGTKELTSGTAGDTAGHLVYERGVKSWPGAHATPLSPHDWAAGRVEAFRRLQSGERLAGYTRDDDLLPGS